MEILTERKDAGALLIVQAAREVGSDPDADPAQPGPSRGLHLPPPAHPLVTFTPADTQLSTGKSHDRGTGAWTAQTGAVEDLSIAPATVERWPTW